MGLFFMPLVKNFIAICILFLVSTSGRAQDTAMPTSDWSFHFQATTIDQVHPDFHSPYEGSNSLQGHENDKISVTSTVYIGCRLWKGGELYINPEIAGGAGLSGASGVAGALNGETYRIGSTAPELTIPFARIYLQENIALTDEMETIAETPNQMGELQPTKRITITIGKYSITDQFDANSLSHDPRSQFFNWSLMSAGAWDYPADTKGYTIGGTIEYITPTFSLRVASDMVARVANQLIFDPNFSKANSETFEVEIPHNIFPNPGTIRILGFYTMAHMGNYRLAIDQAPKDSVPDITATRAYGRSKYGFELNIDQQLGKNISAFSRTSWNDGKNETWMFTEIDQSFSAGCALDGPFRKPGDDIIRGAIVINGISDDHRKYLEAGGSGFILGDGKLNYALEMIFEAQYLTHITRYFALTADYQFVMNPGYNSDRGPVHVFGLRGHVEL
jgi:high affinity Mn2+ porin